MQKRKLGRLSLKLVTMSVLLACIICLALSTSGYYLYRQSTYKTYNSFAYELAEVARSYVNADALPGYLETKRVDAAYEQMVRGLYKIYDNANLTSIYLCIPDPETMTVTTIYDVRVQDAENPDIYALGAVDPIGSNPQAVVDIYTSGQRSDNYFIRENSFGYNTSAILPVIGSGGSATALLVLDVPMPHIQQEMNRYLAHSIGMTGLVVVLFLAVFQVVLQRNVVRPLRLIAAEAAAFTQSHNMPSEKLGTVRTRDEIQVLAETVYKLEVDINHYIKNLTLVTAEKERIGAELDVATQIQASMLPCIFPAFPERPELDIYATMISAKEVGGDFYDFFLVDDDHLAMVMADVSGKGVPAALFMVIAKTLLKNMTQTGLHPSAVLESVNKQLCEGNEAEMFVTVWLGVLEISTGKLLCANAGHEYPVIRRQGGDYELIQDKHGFVLAGMESSRYQEYELQMGRGDRIFLYTDGVPEATNAYNELFGTDRMLQSLNAHRDDDCDALLEHLKQDIDAFVGQAPQFDDITMLSLALR